MKYFATSILLTFLFVSNSNVFGDVSWDVIKTYKYGDDLKPLLEIEKAVEASTASPGEKKKTAARLASFLTDETTPAGRQFVCMQLRLVGGAAEVPKLAEYMDRSEDRENSRMALADIHGEESLVPLRKALGTFSGESLVGVIGSLSARKDKASIPTLVALLDSGDETVVAAAVRALGCLGIEGVAPLKSRLKTLPNREIAPALIGAANDFAKHNQKTEAKEIFESLTEPGQSKAVRRAAFEGLLRLLGDSDRKSTISRWFLENDPEKNLVAASRLKELSPHQFDELVKKFDSLGPESRTVLLETVAYRKTEELLDSLLKAVKSSDRSERNAALRAMGKLRDPATIAVLLESLGGEDDTTAREALLCFNPDLVGPKLVESLEGTSQRNSAIDLIVSMKYYDAIDPMLKIAQHEDETVFEPVIDGLARLCDPDEYDLPRLLGLYLASRPGRHRDRIERAVVVVCEKQGDPDKRAAALLDILAKRDDGLSDEILVETLPLLGKIGNKRIADLLIPLLKSEKPELKQAAVRALCNWPNADYLNELYDIATNNTNGQYRQWALRAYIRVATLKSDRPESKTLDMLKKAMDAAVADADKQFCLSRTSAVRTMDSVDWAASFLDDPILAQAACKAIVELAHHRFLREPNKAKFEPILLKVEKTTKDKSIAERAQKSRLGM